MHTGVGHGRRNQQSVGNPSYSASLLVMAPMKEGEWLLLAQKEACKMSPGVNRP
jgi:hypothetical protein